MDENIIPRGYGACPNLVVDGAGHYCKILKVPEQDYPHKYRRVMCFGRENNMSCEDAKNRFGLKESLENI